MKFENNKIFQILEVVTAFFQLNVIWLIFCLPIITIFPATVAMYCVIRQWIRHKDYSVFRNYFRYFKENFKQSLILGVIWTFFTALFFIDLMIVKNFGSFRMVLIPGLFLLGILVTFITIFIFPVIANYDMNWRTVIKNSMFFSIRYFPTTLISICCLAITFVLLFTWPITCLFIFSSCAFCIYFVCNRVFNKIQQLSSAK